MSDERPTHLDLFSGIGGFALAAQWAGFRTIGFCEIDKYCQKLLAKNVPADTLRLCTLWALGRRKRCDSQFETQRKGRTKTATLKDAVVHGLSREDVMPDDDSLSSARTSENSTDDPSRESNNLDRFEPRTLHKPRVDDLQIRLGWVRDRRSDKFLEARVIPERIKHRIQPEQRRSKRRVISQWTCIGYGKEFL